MSRIVSVATCAVVLVLSAAVGFAQETAPSLPTVTLDDCVAAAKAGSPALRLASLTLDSARAALLQEQAKNGLALGESGQYFHQGNLPGTTTSSSAVNNAAAAASGSGLNGENVQAGLNLSGPATSVDLTAQHSISDSAFSDQVSSLNLSGSHTVFDGYPGGRAAGAVQQAQATFRVAQVAYDAALKSALYQVKQAYYTLLGDQATVLQRQAISRQASENLALYNGLFAAGKATKLDVLQVQVALTQAQLDVRTAQNATETDRRRLSQGLGWPLENQYLVADTSLPALPSFQPEEALKTALRNRSEILTLQQNVDAAGIALALQKSQYQPTVSLKASVGVGQAWSANVSTGAFTAGVSVALPPLWDGGLQSASVQDAAAKLSSYQLQQAQQGESVSIDVRGALFAVVDAHDRSDLAAQNLQQAQGQYDLQKAKLAVGLSTILDELTAFTALAAARVGLEQAKTAYQLAVLNLYNVMGL
jgi:outer membrane protein TolC